MAHACRRLLTTAYHRSCPNYINKCLWPRPLCSASTSVDATASTTRETCTSGQASASTLISGKDLLVDLRERGLSVSESNEMQDLFVSGQPITVYGGFDPTGDSLHVGHLPLLLSLLRFHEAGHNIIALVGGATAIVGDPSDQVADRSPMEREVIVSNTESLMAWLEQFFEKNRQNQAEMRVVNNLDWYKDMPVLEFFSKYASDVRVSTLLGREFVQTRLQGGGLNMKEFSYQMFQGTDFLQLHKLYGCNLQIGGSDQWPNILSGVDIIKKQCSATVHGMTLPLITNANGTKLSKSSGTAPWLNEEKTTPFQLYQFFVVLEDSVMDQYVNLLSFLPVKEIRRIARENRIDKTPWVRQTLLGKEMINVVHGERHYEVALAVTQVLYGRSWTPEIAQTLTEEMLQVLSTELPFTKLPASSLKDADIVKLISKLKLLNKSNQKWDSSKVSQIVSALRT
eukprot:scpid80358/ scgid14811/ Tyrosine--tRNA ligase, mitochondrial; Tyrosyl-tRNA synthetase